MVKITKTSNTMLTPPLGRSHRKKSSHCVCVQFCNVWFVSLLTECVQSCMNFKVITCYYSYRGWHFSFIWYMTLIYWVFLIGVEKVSTFFFCWVYIELVQFICWFEKDMPLLRCEICCDDAHGGGDLVQQCSVKGVWEGVRGRGCVGVGEGVCVIHVGVQ